MKELPQSKLTEEQWRPVLSYEGLYEVSDRGRVRAVFQGGKKYLKPGRIKKATIAANGYFVVNLFRPPGRKSIKQAYVHRLVIEAFVGPISKGMETRHLDGVRTNNNISNLKAGTHQENTDDKYRHGTAYWGEYNKNLGLLQALRADGKTYREIAAFAGITQTTAWNALNRK